MEMPLPEKINQGSTSSVSFKLLRTELGNGQMQIAPDGLNFRRLNYNIEWTALTLFEKNTITAALDSTNGHELLTWRPIGELRTINFRMVDGYSWSTNGGDVYSVSVEVTEDFR